MRNISLLTILLVSLGLLFGGCASTGITASSHITNIQLGGPNFRIVSTNVTGEASSRALFGVSYGLGVAATQLALIPLDSERTLYKKAISTLWTTFETENGPVEGRKLALVNVRYDSESINTFFYTKVTTVIVADVVEFE